MVQKVAGSGHTNLVRELYPPVKISMPAARRDSLVESDKQRRPSTERGRRSKRDGSQDATSSAKMPHEVSTVPQQPTKPTFSTPNSNTLPPHLRNKSQVASAAATRPASKPIITATATAIAQTKRPHHPRPRSSQMPELIPYQSEALSHRESGHIDIFSATAYRRS